MTKLIQINEETHDIKLDLRYATKNNVCNTKLYQKAQCFLHPKAKENFETAIKLAKTIDLKFKIFDAYRPYQVQKFMYEKFRNDYISNPQTGSVPHCRGVALDLTLIDQNDQELEMGSDFDEFSSLAFHSSKKISNAAEKNRKLLLEIMTKAGFDFFEKEWWHYQLFNARDYEIAQDINLLSAV